MSAWESPPPPPHLPGTAYNDILLVDRVCSISFMFCFLNFLLYFVKWIVDTLQAAVTESLLDSSV